MNGRRLVRLLGPAFLLTILLPVLAVAQEQPLPAQPVPSQPVPAQPATKSPAEAREAWIADYRWLGAALSASFPYAEFGDDYNTGYGVHAIVDKPLWPLINLSGDIGYTHFAGNEEQESVDIWNLLVGGRFVFGAFFIGAEGGWLTEVDDLGWVPSMGCRFDKLEFAFRWVTSGPDAWTTLRAGYYF